MNNLICSHCRTEVPRGATVCTGCQSEVEYGPEKGYFGAALLAAAFAGYQAHRHLPESMSVGSWIVGVLVFVGLSALIQKAFGNRVVFKRVYKTRR
jgi:hypothetical protein